MNLLPITIESLVAILLLLTILYCVRLNKQLSQLRADETAMKTTVAELIAATENAQRSILGLKETVLDADEILGDRLRAAEKYCAEIVTHTEAGTEILHKITQIAGTRNEAPIVKPPKLAPKPPERDAKAIMAAAQAFADRARARMKGAAA
jgi:hypothetical protein